MTGVPTHAARAARLLAQRRSTPPAREMSREEGVGIVAQAILERSRRRRTRVLLGGCVVAASAAAAAVVFTLGWLQQPNTVKVADSPPVDKGSVEGQPFLPGARVATTSERARVIEFGTG